MKITQFNPDHPYLLGAGITLGSTASPVDPAIIEQLTNQSGGSVTAGDVVLIDTAHDESFVTTSLSFVTSAIGIALDTIASGAAGSVITAGFAPVVNVNGSNTTRGFYLGTGAAKTAATAATRQAGTFGQLLTGGTAPSATIWAPDLSAGGNPGVGTVTDGSTTVTGVTEIDFTSGATVSAGGAGVVNVLITGSSPFLNVKDYGATGNGTTDDTAAIAAAVTAADATNGATIFFPPGTYKITSTISLTGQNYHVLGAGSRYGPSRINQVTANTSALVFAPSSGTGLRTKTSLVENLVISGAGSGSAARGLDATNDLHVENVFIYGFYDGIYLRSASYYSYVSHSTFTACGRAGIVLDSTNNTTIDTCRFTGAWAGSSAPIGAMQYGIFIGCTFPTGLNTKIVNCSIEYFTLDGIYGSGMFGCEISGTYFETQQSSTGHAHINLGPGNAAKAVFIHGNYFQGDGTAGFNAILGTATDRITVTGNYFGVNSAIGISASGGGNTNWLVENNVNSPAGTFSLPAGSSYTLDPSNPPIADPTTTEGDMIYRHSGAVARLAVGASGTVLHGGTDPAYSAVVEGDLSLSNVTTANVSTSKHGLAPILPNDATKFLDGTGAYSTPVSGAHFLVIASSHSTPLVFADIVQTPAGDDFTYTS